MKKNIILIIVINILLTVSKFLIIVEASMRSFLDEGTLLYGKSRNYLVFVIGCLIAIGLDLLINCWAVTVANKKTDKKIKYYKVIIIPIIITIILILLGLF